MHEELIPEDIEEEYTPPDNLDSFRMACTFCKGTGVHPATMKSLAHALCPTCKGRGILDFRGNRYSFRTCWRCGGTGREFQSASIRPCHTCRGYGIV
jgi:DnaJ-class molecular chaperone